MVNWMKIFPERVIFSVVFQQKSSPFSGARSTGSPFYEVGAGQVMMMFLYNAETGRGPLQD